MNLRLSGSRRMIPTISGIINSGIKKITRQVHSAIPATGCAQTTKPAPRAAERPSTERPQARLPAGSSSRAKTTIIAASVALQVLTTTRQIAKISIEGARAAAHEDAIPNAIAQARIRRRPCRSASTANPIASKVPTRIRAPRNPWLNWLTLNSSAAYVCVSAGALERKPESNAMAHKVEKIVVALWPK